MNILYISQSCNPYNGSEDQIGWNIPWEAAKEDNVHVITRTDLKQDIEAFLAKNEKRNIKFYYVDVSKMYKKLFKGFFYSGRLLQWNRRALPLAKKICDEHNIQIIHQLTPIEFRSIGAFGDIENTKFVCGPLGAGQYIAKPMMSYVKGKAKIVELSRKIINDIFRAKLEMDGRLKKCDYTLFTNEETYQYLGGEKLGSQCAFFYDNGIEDIALNKSSLQQEKQQDTVFLVVGRLLYIKGHEFLLDVLEELSDGLQYKCRIVGNGPMMERLQQLVESKRLQDKVELVGTVPYTQVQKEYEKADVLLFPSLRESSGTVILEAMTNAMPVVTVNRFGGKIILDEKCAWFFDGDTLDEFKSNLKNILIECIKDKDIIYRKGQQAKKEVEKHTWSKKVDYYRTIYNDLIGEN